VDNVTSTLQTATTPPPLSVPDGEAGLRRFLLGLPGVDKVGLEARSARLGTRSIKTTAKALGIDLAISMIDLTTLEGADTPGKVRSLCAKARRPDPADPTCPSTAAVCVYPDLAAIAKAELAGTGVHVASVATAFPSGRASLEVKLADTRLAVEAGADEVDMVIDRGAFLAGHFQQVFDEIAAVKGRVRPGAPEGDPGDRRAGHVRQRAPRLLAGDAGRRRLHQDLDRQGQPGRDPAGDAGDARGGARLPRPRQRPQGRA
jgi:deoxyribose-phosphate aldolase